VLTLTLLAQAGTAAEESTKTTNPILPTGNEIVWGLITFFLLLALMKWVLLPPVMRVMREREARLRAERQAAEQAETGAAEARSAYDARIAQARAEANTILGAAREDADQYRAQRFAEANADIARWREEAAAEVSEAKSVALARLRGDVAQVAVAAAGRVMGKNLDLSTELAAIEEYVNNQTGNSHPGGARAGAGTGDGADGRRSGDRRGGNKRSGESR
jgi:F-type H+-transporting ATPase subunit b